MVHVDELFKNVVHVALDRLFADKKFVYDFFTFYRRDDLNCLHPRHIHTVKNDVRFQLIDHADYLDSVNRIPHYFHIVFVLKDVLKPFSKQIVTMCD